MAFPDLRSFIDELDRRGQLQRVGVEVDPVLEITEIADRVSKAPAAGDTPPPAFDRVHGGRGGDALLFENVKGSDIPLGINLYGSYERMRIALGCESFEQLAGRIEQLVKPQIPTSLMDKMKKLPDLVKLANFGPKIVKRGICQEVVHTDDADLLTLPSIQCWPDDGGRYITFAGIYTKDIDTGDRNVGMYRVQIFEPKMTAMHWHVHHDGPRHHRGYKARGEKMPLAIVFGGESVLPYAATCPLPPDMSELLFAGFLNNGGIDLVQCKTIDMQVPVNAEIVIEGYVEPHETITEGPFGDHTGYYSMEGKYPVYRVTAITHRRDPIFPATIVGLPPQEDYYLGKVTERIFLPLLKMLIPDVIDYSLPMFGAFHNCAFVKIKKVFAHQARRVINAIWGAGQMSFCKMIVVLDEDVDVHDEQDVLFHMCANVDWRRDTMIVEGPVDILDHASPYEGSGAKIGIDATRTMSGEGIYREYPPLIRMSEAVVEKVTRRWSEYGFDA